MPYLILQSYTTVNNFIIFCLFIYGRKKQYDMFDTCKINFNWLIILIVVTFYVYCSQAPSIFIYKNCFCMDPENVPGASGVFKKDNMKLTVYFKLWSCLICIIIKTLIMIIIKCNIIRFIYFIIKKYLHHWKIFFFMHSCTIIFSYLYTCNHYKINQHSTMLII